MATLESINLISIAGAQSDPDIERGPSTPRNAPLLSDTENEPGPSRRILLQIADIDFHGQNLNVHTLGYSWDDDLEEVLRSLPEQPENTARIYDSCSILSQLEEKKGWLALMKHLESSTRSSAWNGQNFANMFKSFNTGNLHETSTNVLWRKLLSRQTFLSGHHGSYRKIVDVTNGFVLMEGPALEDNNSITIQTFEDLELAQTGWQSLSTILKWSSIPGKKLIVFHMHIATDEQNTRKRSISKTPPRLFQNMSDAVLPMPSATSGEELDDSSPCSIGTEMRLSLAEIMSEGSLAVCGDGSGAKFTRLMILEFLGAQFPHFATTSSLKFLLKEPVEPESTGFINKITLSKQLQDAATNLIDLIEYVNSGLERLSQRTDTQQQHQDRLLELQFSCEQLRKFTARTLEFHQRNWDNYRAVLSTAESESLKRLTVLAAVFLPLSLSSSILSMNTRFKDLHGLLYDFLVVVFLLGTLALIFLSVTRFLLKLWAKEIFSRLARLNLPRGVKSGQFGWLVLLPQVFIISTWVVLLALLVQGMLSDHPILLRFLPNFQ